MQMHCVQLRHLQCVATCNVRTNYMTGCAVLYSQLHLAVSPFFHILEVFSLQTVVACSKTTSRKTLLFG